MVSNPGSYRYREMSKTVTAWQWRGQPEGEWPAWLAGLEPMLKNGLDHGWWFIDQSPARPHVMTAEEFGLKLEPAGTERLRGALSLCAATFRGYEKIHLLKDTADGRAKARANRELAVMCEDALATVPPASPSEDLIQVVRSILDNGSIECAPGRMGGRPVVRGHRFLVENVLGELADGPGPAAFCENFDHFKKEEIVGLLEVIAVGVRDLHAAYARLARGAGLPYTDGDS